MKMYHSDLTSLRRLSDSASTAVEMAESLLLQSPNQDVLDMIQRVDQVSCSASSAVLHFSLQFGDMFLQY